MPELAPPASAKELIPRLPRTFRPTLNEEIGRWDLLFPAERRRMRAQFDWLAQLPRPEFERLFAPIAELEKKMELPPWDSASAGLSIEDTGLLARSPLYPRWRSEVEKAFAQIDDAVQNSEQTANRLVVCALPAGLPLTDSPLWPDLEKQGKWLRLNAPFGGMLNAFAAALAKRKLAQAMDDVEGTWVFECDTRLSPLVETTAATAISWTALQPARREFLGRLNAISRTLKSVDRTSDDLRRIDIGRLMGPAIGGNPRIREFVRSLLLSGNGSLVFNNSFVQWGASEALRRVQPQALFACFGIRPKLKPFSSAVLFEDQNRSNPAPDEDDPAGSLVDASILASYVHLAARRIPGYEKRTLTLMAASGLDRVLLLGPANASAPTVPVTAEGLATLALEWLATPALS